MPEPVGAWYMNDDTGTTARDAMGLHPANGSNIRWCGQSVSCATFDGTDSQFATSKHVLDTAPGSSFTVSAWAYLTEIKPDGDWAALVSQDGAYAGRFPGYPGMEGKHPARSGSVMISSGPANG